jgi:hypothetical protein
LTANSERWKCFIECNRMLAFHIPYIIYRWKSRSSDSLQDNVLPVPDFLQIIQVPPMLLYTIHCKNSSCVHVTVRLLRN